MENGAEAEKKAAARSAVEHVRNNMTLGLGTGSTARYFIEALGEKVREGWSLAGVPTSDVTERFARAAGIDIIIPDETTRIDLGVDGADELDPQLNLIKGGGAALLREKIVASAASKMIIIADGRKRVATLGAFDLPVEIEPFGWALTVASVRRTLRDALGRDVDILLRHEGGDVVTTDGGNLIVDCQCQKIDEPAALDAALNAIPGVLENGLFCGVADLALIGVESGAAVRTLARS